jgi:hypothetical protein
VAQFVPLKVDTEGNDWQVWARKYRPEGRAIPILYVIRADGQMLYGKSGDKEGDELRRFLAEHLVVAGKIFSDQQLAAIKAAVDEANQARADGDSFTAVKRIDSLRKLGTAGKLGSYATVAREADALYTKLVEEGETALKAAQEKLVAEQPFDGVLGILAANRIYGSLPELRTDLVSAERDLGKNAEFKSLVAQAEALDRGLALASQKNAAAKKSAITALGLIVTRYPGTPAAKLAEEKLTELGAQPPAAALPTSRPTGAPLRTWTDTTGKFRVEAELIGVADGKVQLKKQDGAVIGVPLDKLSKEDQEFLAGMKPSRG